MALVVHATARFFDHVVEETVAPSGRPLVLGGTDVMALPRPAGHPHLARLSWKGPRTVIVEDARGRSELLEPGQDVIIEEGPLRLELRMIRRFRLRRLADWSTVATTLVGIGLLSIVLNGVGNTVGQAGVVNQVWCATWVGQVAPPEALPIARSIFAPCQPPGAVGGGGIPGNQGNHDRMAEYLERILAEDFDGEETGVLAEGDRQYGEGKRDDRDVYMPAGDAGTQDAMGGADEQTLRPNRIEAVPKEKKEAPRDPEPQQVATAENGTPVDLGLEAPPEDPADEDQDAVSDDIEGPDQRTEDRKGWGIRDWYDQEERERDQQEIEVMTELADRILAINPNDPEALSVKAYYEYLNEDYKGATKTYDKFIELYPEEPAGYNNKALVYKREGKYAEEERLYRIALSLEPDDVTALNNLAVNLAHQGRHEEALEIMEQLEVLDPGEPYADLHRAKIHAEMGNDDGALAYLEKALQGMEELDTLHHMEFRQDIRVDPSLARLRKSRRFKDLLWRYYGDDSPIPTQ